MQRYEIKSKYEGYEPDFLLRHEASCCYVPLVASEEQGVATVRDDVHLYLLPYDLHHAQVVGGDWEHDDAVVILIAFLHLGQVLLDAVIHLQGRIGQKYGALNGSTPLANEVFVHECTHLVALNIIHNEKQHLPFILLLTFHNAQQFPHTLLQRTKFVAPTTLCGTLLSCQRRERGGT